LAVDLSRDQSLELEPLVIVVSNGGDETQ